MSSGRGEGGSGRRLRDQYWEPNGVQPWPEGKQPVCVCVEAV